MILRSERKRKPCEENLLNIEKCDMMFSLRNVRVDKQKCQMNNQKTGGGNDELNADAGKSIKLLKFIEHGWLLSNV